MFTASAGSVDMGSAKRPSHAVEAEIAVGEHLAFPSWRNVEVVPLAFVLGRSHALAGLHGATAQIAEELVS
jgi:hypothetical protein